MPSLSSCRRIFEILELVELAEEFVVDLVRITRQDLPAAIRNPEVSATSDLEQPRLLQISLCPVIPIGERRLAAAWEELGSLVRGETEFVDQLFHHVADFDFTHRSALQHWQHQRLVVRDTHRMPYSTSERTPHGPR